MSQSLPVVNRPAITAASAVRFAELVKKNETSTAQSLRKRKKGARKKLKQALKEQKRYAKANNLRAVAMTLTYESNAQFEPKHVSAFLDALRRSLKRKGYSLPYVWTLECEERLHYHLVLWLPRDFKLDHARLKKWWPWGSTWAESCRSPGAWGRYMVKFDSAAKLPKGARMFGCGGLDEEGKAAVARAGMPRWLQLLLPLHQHAKRQPGSGWVVINTGEYLASPYVWTARGPVCRPVPANTVGDELGDGQGLCQQ